MSSVLKSAMASCQSAIVPGHRDQDELRRD
jgi:hypothetical protein